MFSYYGSKSKIVDHYPPPKFDMIIEPFAGSAKYSLKYFDKDVILIDKYDVIVNIWKYLQVASKKDILGLPRPKQGDDLRDIKSISKVERHFMGYLFSAVQQWPANKVSKFGCVHMYGGDRKDKYHKIADSLHKIRHWQILLGDYRQASNKQATWFIDAPYQHGGDKYVHSKIDYNHLSKWCQSRIGQSIVCENTKSDWLPFVPFRQLKGIKHRTTEAIWSNLPTAFDNQQLSIFN